MSTLSQGQSSVAAGATRKTSFGRIFGWLSVRVALGLICLIWTLPTFGLLVSSLRDREALAISGWWTTFNSTVTNSQHRTPDSSAQVEEDGLYVISGNVFDDDRGSRELRSYGDGYLDGDIGDYKPGDTVTTRDGFLFTMDEEGDYRLTHTEPMDFSPGKRIFFQVNSPPRFTFDNYRGVINSENLGDAFINTAVVTIPATIIPIAIAAFAAYAFSWMRFPGRLFLLMVVVGLIVVPLQMSLIPILRLYTRYDLVGTYPGIWLAHTGFGLPLAVYLLKNYIGSLPRELIESAQIDGASHFDIFVRLVLPLSVPALASFAIFQFLWVWNDMLVALVFLGNRPENTVLTVALRQLVGSRGDNWEIMTASAFVAIIVPLLVFFALQRYFVRGLMAGSVKG